MDAFLSVMGWPIAACIVLAGIHCYFGFHVIERRVLFVDLALAQVAALGAGVAVCLGFDLETPHAYGISLALALSGAWLFSTTRHVQTKVPQEALIGIIYAVSTALLVLVLSRMGEGEEHIHRLWSGDILLLTASDVILMALLYAAVGIVHILFRKQFLLISTSPEEAARQGLNLPGWDFLFYATFAVVVTSSVKAAGVFFVFAMLIIPPVCAVFLAATLKSKLLAGWAVGIIGGVLGSAVSYHFDLPTSSAIIATLGGCLVGVLLLKGGKK